MSSTDTPFHAGELEAQRRADVGDVASWAGSFIRDYMPEQHRAFFASLPFLVVAAGDASGRPWVTLLDGPDGFIRSPDPRHLMVAARPVDADPLAGSLVAGAEVGMLGIDLATRRRNRLNGLVRATGDGLAIEVRQSFGNCPQYISEREWQRVAKDRSAEARVSTALDAGQRALIAAADTFFVGTGSHGGEGGRASDGHDASHRGGPAGFVTIGKDGTLHIPDYAGNNFFNTIGNLIRDPRIGLVFVEFATGRLLHLTGRARINWTPGKDSDPNARRVIEVTVDEVIDRPAALALRWRDESGTRLLRVIGKVRESAQITSLHLAAADGAALPPFRPGQHLPLELDLPGLADPVRRTYSLSGPPSAGTYRISIKRKKTGRASDHLHFGIAVGDTIKTRAPAGAFILPGGDGPLVLVSAGVGVTPMLSMLHAVAADQPERPVWFVHGTRDGQTHAFRTEVETVLAADPTIRRQIFFSAPEAEDKWGRDFDAEGRVTADALLALDAGAGADYMLCGPARFLADIRAGLERAGVPPEQIRDETFGPS